VPLSHGLKGTLISDKGSFLVVEAPEGLDKGG
jgi:hypothetical protein